MIDITDDALNEIAALAAFIQDDPLPILQRRVDDVAIPACRRSMSMMKSILDDGIGFSVLDRLPVDEYPVETLVEIYWILGQCIGRPGSAEMEWAKATR